MPFRNQRECNGMASLQCGCESGFADWMVVRMLCGRFCRYNDHDSAGMEWCSTEESSGGAATQASQERSSVGVLEKPWERYNSGCGSCQLEVSDNKPQLVLVAQQAMYTSCCCSELEKRTTEQNTAIEIPEKLMSSPSGSEA